MTQQGHNSGKLKELAESGREGLRQVAESEDKAIAGWRQYGEAVYEGREAFPSDKEFGQWKHSEGLCDSRCPECKRVVQVEPDRPYYLDTQAAMWLAANPEEFETTREAYPHVRTVRGLHAKWKKEQKPDEDDTDDDDDVVDNDDTQEDTPEATVSISDAEKAILQFNSLSDEEKIKQLGGRPGVIDQKELDEKLESDYNPLNSASAVLVSLNRLRIYGGKKEIERNIMQVLSQSSRMKSYEAEALVLLGEIILEKRDELESMYSNTTDLNKLN